MSTPLASPSPATSPQPTRWLWVGIACTVTLDSLGQLLWKRLAGDLPDSNDALILLNAVVHLGTAWGMAGVLLAGIGAAGCFALSAASSLPFIGVALWILPRGRPAPLDPPAPGWQALGDALRQLLRRSTVRGTLLTVFCSSLLCAQLLTFAPVLVKNAFQGGAGHFSLAVSAFGVGGLLGAVLLLMVPPEQDRRRLSAHFALAYGVILVLAAVDPWFWALPVLLAAAGTAMSVSNISGNTLIQTGTESRLRGQAVSLYMLAMRGGLSVGSLLTGLSVGALGVRQALLLNGVLAVLAQLAIGRRWLRTAA